MTYYIFCLSKHNLKINSDYFTLIFCFQDLNIFSVNFKQNIKNFDKDLDISDH